jgi:hypothetical protein
MKQLVIALLKVLGIYLLFSSLTLLIQNAFYLHLLKDADGNFGNDYTFFIWVLIQPIIQLLLFYLLVFKTESLIKLFKIQWEETSTISYKTILKSGIFLIGFYFFLTSFPLVFLHLIKLLVEKLSSENGYSLNGKLVGVFTPFSADILINSLVFSTIGFFVALKHRKIADYFIQKDAEGNKNIEN